MDAFMQWLAANSLKGAVLIIAVFLVQFVFSKQIPQKWKYLMWILVAVRLLMPTLFESDSSIFNLKKIWQTETVNSVQTSAPLPEQVPVVETTLQQITPINIAAPEPEMELTTVVFYVWAAVAFLLFLYLLWKNFRLLALVRKERTVIESRWLRLLENCKRELKLYTPVQIIETHHVSTPALMGFVRPRILIPEGILEAMNENEIKLVFMHELTHLKSGDIIINWVVSLIQIIHWFNPLVWFAFAKAREARELACDDRMLSLLEKDDSKKYGLTIIRLLELCCNENKITGMVGILENKKQMKRRIEMIRNPNRKTKKAVILTLILLSFMGAVFLSEAKENTNPEATKEESSNAVLTKKLKDIIIPRLDFEGITVQTAVRHLQEQSKQLDPDGAGVIILMVSESASKRIVDIVLAKKSLYQAIYFLCKAANLKFRVEKHTVVIADSTASWESAALEETQDTGIAKKLKNIIFPNIETNDADIFSVIRFLNRLSKRCDPDKAGVSVIAGFDKGIANKLPKINMKGSNISMDEALRRVCQKTGLDYKISAGAVILVPKTSALAQKLKSIIIPQLDLEKVSVETAIRLLREQSKKLDPDGVGVNIVLMSTSKKPVDLVFAKKSLYDAIYFLCKASGLKFRIQKDLVLITDKSIEHDGFETKTFYVKPGVLAAAGLDDSKKLMKYFKDRGITFSTGSKLLYANQKIPLFIMMNTRENQDKFESIIQNELNKTNPSDLSKKTTPQWLRKAKADRWAISGKKVILSGNVYIPYGKFIVYADKATVNIEDMDLVASGNVRVQTQGKSGELKAKSVTGNLDSGYFKFIDFTGNRGGAILKADSCTLYPDGKTTVENGKLVDAPHAVDITKQQKPKAIKKFSNVCVVFEPRLGRIRLNDAVPNAKMAAATLKTSGGGFFKVSDISVKNNDSDRKFTFKLTYYLNKNQDPQLDQTIAVKYSELPKRCLQIGKWTVWVKREDQLNP